MRTPMLERPTQRAPTPTTLPPEAGDGGAARQIQHRRMRHARLHAAAWALGTAAIMSGWIAHEWAANGAFQRFAHEGNPGDWNPTLPAVAILLWGLAVGIMLLRARFERPATAAEVDREIGRSAARAVTPRARARARARLEHAGRLRFHVSAWLLGIVLLVPLNLLIEWQDNGGFERISGNSKPGSWDPWALYAGGIWALAVAVFVALPVYLERRKTG